MESNDRVGSLDPMSPFADPQAVTGGMAVEDAADDSADSVETWTRLDVGGLPESPEKKVVAAVLLAATMLSGLGFVLYKLEELRSVFERLFCD